MRIVRRASSRSACTSPPAGCPPARASACARATAAPCAHRQRHVGAGQHRRVVDAVADHGDHVRHASCAAAHRSQLALRAWRAAAAVRDRAASRHASCARCGCRRTAGARARRRRAARASPRRRRRAAPRRNRSAAAAVRRQPSSTGVGCIRGSSRGCGTDPLRGARGASAGPARRGREPGPAVPRHGSCKGTGGDASARRTSARSTPPADGATRPPARPRCAAATRSSIAASPAQSVDWPHTRA